MALSVFDIFKIGIGPSSSHTVGPMNAARKFILKIEEDNKLQDVENIMVHLYGSLALTKNGHGTVLAIELGLEGCTPENINLEKVADYIEKPDTSSELELLNKKTIKFTRDGNFKCHYNEELEYHTNGICLEAYNSEGKIIYKNNYYSVGGGFVVSDDDLKNKDENNSENSKNVVKLPYVFKDMKELMDICKREKKSIWEIALENEKSFRPIDIIDRKCRKVWLVIDKAIENGLTKTGNIPGGLSLKRRAPSILKKLEILDKSRVDDPLRALDWVNMWGIAYAEENASFGRVVTAPTNGASGVIPAVLLYYEKYIKGSDFEGVKRFILTAGTIGILCKKNASISGAECGCQAEIGSACAMAAAGLTAALNGTNEQIENAAIIGLTHNLGLACDPISGLVQIPCIERNGINAVKAITATRLAMIEEKSVYLHLDQVINAMREIGKEMPCSVKETAKGGLALTAAHNGIVGDVDFNQNLCKNCSSCK